MTSFERASVALIYNLYFSRKAYTGEAIKTHRYTVETYDEDYNLLKRRYFNVREVSPASIDLEWEEGYRYRVFNTKIRDKHTFAISTQEREKETIEIDRMDSAYVYGMAASSRFTMEHQSTDSVKIHDEENNKTYRYRIIG